MIARRFDRSLRLALRLVGYISVAFTCWVLADIVINGFPALTLSFLLEFPKRGGRAGGILPPIAGTLCLVAGAVAVALPLGVGTAIYLSEFRSSGVFSRGLRLAITTLAGVPSIVFGLFGLGLFVLFLGFGTSILSGSLTLACMILPTIIVTSEEALRAVPQSFREASLALGANRWQTVSRCVLPYALPGILTGAILGVGRAAGETAPILLTAAAFYLPRLPQSIFDQVMALPYHLYMLATQYPEAGKIRPLQYGTALVLILVVLSVNAAAIVLRAALRRKYRW